MSRVSTQILDLVTADQIDCDALESAFDEATHEQRVQAIREFTPKIQKRLFEAAEGRRVDIEHIVPSEKGSLEEVIHEGQNTLPAFRKFQKRFCRPSRDQRQSNREVLWGYNHQTMSPFTGPGYFVAYEDEESGEVWIDYRELPTERPDEWPKIISNKARLGRFVYHGMVDRLRRVSQHCTIGRAYKGKPMDAWFVLVRAD
ncbi:hypothetical protein FIV42_08840 [Persicimonas caeni]|uniref:Uncharacterized protein n=1 Tax=Persicimonas caeni TaxID=2292766 RepID=A0A4Y6PRI0_PERCE|nr:hypothetical protein [Persicimonas caeni]QDG50833.1 hypothetical protein FIV42_08840 [Persicimonas caeni]QED32054.1 hypothetical protein FRD00_08835 [Persicimonas caeni]